MKKLLITFILLFASTANAQWNVEAPQVKAYLNFNGVEQAAKPDAPAAGSWNLYFKTDNKLYKQDEADVETEIASGSSGDMVAATYDPAGIAEQLLGLVAAQTVTNKTFDADNNTFSNIGSAEIKPEIISGQSLVTTVATDMVLILDATDGALKKADVADLLAGGAGDLWSDVVDAVITPDADGTRDLGLTGTRFATGYFDNLDITTNIVVGGTVDGRDVATDGTKLDGIEALADVTDTANVTSAGALMDSELSGIAAVKATTAAFLIADETKLDGIETGATADQSDAEIETAYNNQVGIVSQVDAEAGTSTTRAGWTAQRVAQAIAALAAGSGTVTTTGTPADSQIAIFTAANDIEGSANFTFNTGDFIVLDPVNDGNPTIQLGATSSEQLHITTTYETGTQLMEYVLFHTDVAKTDADLGELRFSPDGVLNLTIDDGGIEVRASGSISFGAVDILTDSSGTTTLANIDLIDAATETTLEAAIDSLVNLTAVGTITSGTWQGTTVAVDQGGTGATTFTDGAVLLGSGTGAVTALDVTAKGSLMVGDGTTDPVALAVGTNDYVLTADSAEASGMKWAAASGGGGGGAMLPRRFLQHQELGLVLQM